MATFDLGLFEHFAIIFPFLLVWVISYVVLSFSPRMDNKNLNAIISFSLAFIFVLSKDAVAILNFTSPWFVFFFIFIMFVILAFKILGASDSDILNTLKGKKGQPIITWIIIFSVLIVLLGFSSVIGQDLLNEQYNGNGEVVESGDGGVASVDHEETLVETIFHPKVLAMVVILAIASLTIKQLSVIPE